ELARRGIFRQTRAAAAGPEEVEVELGSLIAERRYEAFMSLAVRSRRNIVVSGPTGSGKTTWTKALIREIPPHERLVTIEDAPELVLDSHPNHVRLFYSKDDQGLARVTPKQLLEATLRMKPTASCWLSCGRRRPSIICAMSTRGIPARSRACMHRAPRWLSSSWFCWSSRAKAAASWRAATSAAFCGGSSISSSSAAWNGTSASSKRSGIDRDRCRQCRLRVPHCPRDEVDADRDRFLGPRAAARMVGARAGLHHRAGSDVGGDGEAARRLAGIRCFARVGGNAHGCHGHRHVPGWSSPARARCRRRRPDGICDRWRRWRSAGLWRWPRARHPPFRRTGLHQGRDRDRRR